MRQAGLADPLRLGVTVGPITVHLEEELVLEPDLVFVRQDRMSIVDPEGHRHGPPDLVVEILGERRAARVVQQPLYDPDNQRLLS